MTTSPAKFTFDLDLRRKALRDHHEHAVRVGQDAMAAGLRVEPLLLREGAGRCRQFLRNLGPASIGDQPNRSGGFVFLGKKGMHGGFEGSGWGKPG